MPELIFSVLYNEIILVWCFQPYCLQHRNTHAYSRDAADAWAMGRDTARICECACAASAQDFACTSFGWGRLPTHPTRGWVVLGPHNKVRHYFISAFFTFSLLWELHVRPFKNSSITKHHTFQFFVFIWCYPFFSCYYQFQRNTSVMSIWVNCILFYKIQNTTYAYNICPNNLQGCITCRLLFIISILLSKVSRNLWGTCINGSCPSYLDDWGFLKRFQNQLYWVCHRFEILRHIQRSAAAKLMSENFTINVDLCFWQTRFWIQWKKQSNNR